MLELLDIAGCIITIDAMGTQTRIAHQIKNQGANYILALKANHPTLYQEVEQWFREAQASDFQGIEYTHDVRVESGHHRREKREVTAVAHNQMGVYTNKLSGLAYKPLFELCEHVICGTKPNGR